MSARLELLRDPTFVFAIFVGIYLILASTVVVLAIAVGDAMRSAFRGLRTGR